VIQRTAPSGNDRPIRLDLFDSPVEQVNKLQRRCPVRAGDARGWSYPRAPHTGQAPMPWPATTRWATAICWAGVARFADEAYRPPP
jgi:hypothetical protein